MSIQKLNEEYNTEYTNRLLANRHIFDEIYSACGHRFWKGCGSYLFDGDMYRYSSRTYPKQELLYKSVKDATHVLEIGVYMGHSILIMLLSNPSLKITCIDIHKSLSGPAVGVLNKYFNNAITFIHSDSLTALKGMTQKYDFFHVDGLHDDTYITQEFNCIKGMNSRSDKVLKIIFDDQECILGLQKRISTTENVLVRVEPSCIWNNVYYEIQL